MVVVFCLEFTVFFLAGRMKRGEVAIALSGDFGWEGNCCTRGRKSRGSRGGAHEVCRLIEFSCYYLEHRQSWFFEFTIYFERDMFRSLFCFKKYNGYLMRKSRYIARTLPASGTFPNFFHFPILRFKF